MDTAIIISIVFGVIICALSIVIIVLILSLKKNRGNEAVYDEFRRNREELAQRLDMMSEKVSKEISDGNKMQREDIGRANEAVNEKLSKMNEENYKSRIALTEKISESLNGIRQNNIEQNERQTRVVAETIGKMQESNEKKLEEMRVTVDEKLTATLTTRLNTSFKTVSEQLENVYKSLGEMKELSNGVTDLNRVLTNVKARGTWAEVQLEAILDQTIPGMYVKNYSPKVNGERVEFAVKIPSGEKKDEIVYLPIDSKFPMEDYVRVCTAADSADPALLSAAQKALEDRVLSEAKDVMKYISVPDTTPFAILYLATEGLYAEIASSKNGVAEKLQAKNIMIAGPTTITALLNSFAMGFKAIAINEKADEVRKVLAAAKTQYETFGTVLEKAKRKIDDAGKTLDEAQKRNSIIQKKLKSVEALEAAEAQSILGDGEEPLPEYTDEEI